MINIGKYIEMAINWLTENFTLFFDAINVGIGGFIDGFQNVLMWIPFYITIVLLTLLAWYKSGKGVGVFTVFGLLLIWSMGFWNETMQTLALVLSSTIIALIIGLPLGIWSANSQRCDKILHPILDNACFCLPDSRCPLFWIGHCAWSICNYHLCYASGGTFN